MTPARVYVKNKAHADRLVRNLAGSTPAARQKDRTSEIMSALQAAAALALDLAGVKGKARRDVLLSGELNRHCLKAAREIAGKI